MNTIIIILIYCISICTQGLALINGTQFISALGCEAYHRAKLIADQADIISALSIDVLQGTPKAFDQGIIMNALTASPINSVPYVKR